MAIASDSTMASKLTTTETLRSIVTMDSEVVGWLKQPARRPGEVIDRLGDAGVARAASIGSRARPRDHRALPLHHHGGEPLALFLELAADLRRRPIRPLWFLK